MSGRGSPGTPCLFLCRTQTALHNLLPGCRALCASAPRLAALQQALPQPLRPASFRVLHARSLALYSCATAVSSLPDPSQGSELLLAAAQLLMGHLVPWQQVAHLASLARQGAAMLMQPAWQHAQQAARLSPCTAPVRRC